MIKEKKLAYVVDIYMFIAVIACTIGTMKFLMNWFEVDYVVGTIILAFYAALGIAGYQADAESYKIKYTKE